MVYSVIAALAAMLGLIFVLRGPSLLFYLIWLFLLFLLVKNASERRVKIILVLVVFTVYAGLAMYGQSQNQTLHHAGEQIIEARVHSLPKIDGDSLSLRVKSSLGELIQVHGYFDTMEQQKAFKQVIPGDQCRFEGSLHTPSDPTNFYQFNYKQYLYEQNIHWILQPDLSKLSCQSVKSSVYYRLQAFRHHQMERIQQQVHPKTAGIIIALVFGERMYVENEVIKAYQQLGVIHLLAVSGLHVGLIVSALFFLFIRLGTTRERAYDILCLFLPIYIVLAGGAPSVVRAALMTLLVLLFLRFKVPLPPLFSIIIVFLLYLAIQPFILFQLGFQLSFLVSFVLLLSAETINRVYSRWASRLLAVTILAQLASLPLLLSSFYQFSFLTLLLNIIFIPLISFIVLPLSLLSVLLMNVLPLSLNVPILLLQLIIPPLHQAIVNVNQVPMFSFVTGKPYALVLVCFFLVCLISLIKWEQQKRSWWLTPVVGFLFVCMLQVSIPFLKTEAVVTMLDVGQGDSFVIELPRRRAVYVIDTGGTIRFQQEEWRQRETSYDVGRDVVLHYLNAKGIRRVDALILSHGHYDHIGGAKELVGGITINNVLYGIGDVEGEFERELLTGLAAHGAAIEFVEAGITWREGDSQFAVLSPFGTEQELNDRSIVLYAEIEGVRFLFTGDLEEGGEERLVREYPQLSIDVLKVSHHGSRTSTTESFLTHVKPKLALISAGRNNRFNHPHEEVTERLDEHEIPVLRTDQHGAVQLHIENGSMKFVGGNMKKTEQRESLATLFMYLNGTYCL
ncbi:DNA internalization-related competence protein ComEC/Rec2 [Bacillus sp. FJAT-45037]|uniref:DNA internalization-related competence protein ComEC/Rec2 n=1 Tax=Bacillus sp. FJAT-45037 TaxID=2011007 RepID=UPI000C24A51A|nr:DNA internalization-related competence protein ComEC/Rec2 [Bacillus sp. FJAT-45037]